MLKQEQVAKAVKEAMKDPKLLDFFAETIGKKLIDTKVAASNLEETVVKRHVVFAPNTSETGRYLTAKEVETEILKLDPSAKVSMRAFGKALLSDADALKQTNEGRKYYIEAIVENVKDYVPAEVEEKADVEEEEEETPKTKKAKTEEKETKKKDKKKKVSEEEEEEEEEDTQKIKPATPEEAFEAPVSKKAEVNADLLLEAVNGFSDIDEYKEHLLEMKPKKLIKYINKYKMPLAVDIDRDKKKKIVQMIVDLVVENMPEEEEEAPKKDKKKDKKKKKNK